MPKSQFKHPTVHDVHFLIPFSTTNTDAVGHVEKHLPLKIAN